MVYADYAFYVTEYMGQALTEDSFPRCARLASTFLDYYTMGKSAKYADLPALKMACCAMAEQYLTVENASLRAINGDVQSESVGRWSRTFRSQDEVQKSVQAQLANTAQMYLAGTGLLNRSIPVCGHMR